jgi:N-acetylglutamate synthase-like GNAT family acetyltransferase
MNTNDVNIYIAYIDDKPVAYLSCALLDKNAILLNTIVLKEYREKGVINAFIKEIIKKAREVGIEYYTSIIMSPQIQKKFEEQGCITEFLCDLWYYNK